MRWWLLVASSLALLLAGACSDDTPPTPAPISDDPGDDMDYDPPDPELRPRNLTCLAPPRPPAPGLVALERVLDPGLSGARAVKLTDLRAGASGRWYFAQQDGVVVSVDADGSARVALDLAGRIWLDHPEAGLLSLTPHPDIADNGRLFVVYTAPRGDGFISRLSRFESRDAGATFDPASEVVLIERPEPAPIHNADHVVFGPDGYLYVTLGDGGAGSTQRLAQDPGALYGKVLRIDADRDDPARGTTYAIPPDNPVRDGAAPEVWAWGFRNPWRFSFDRQTGELWLGDVGHVGWEEINRVTPGGNYGWPITEGPGCFRAEQCEEEGKLLPYWAYTHSEGRSVTGGFVYRGAALPALSGRYVFADYVNGNLWALRERDGVVEAELLLESGRNISSIAEGPDGELLILSYAYEAENGGVFRLVGAPPSADTFPRRLSQTGCVKMEAPSEPAPGVFPYQVRAELWSDGADKERFFAIPDNRRITVGEGGDLLFPVGTVFVKHFKFEGRYHETRLLVHHEDGWGGYSYAWDEDQTDAALLDVGQTLTLGNGQRWSWPSRSQCFTCHTQAVERVLGAEVAQLDFEVEVPAEAGEAAQQNQLRWLVEHDFMAPGFKTREDVVGGVVAMPDPLGVEGSVEERARAWLHANCGGCHRPGGTTARGQFDLRFSTPFAQTGLCNAEPQDGKPGHIPNGLSMKLITPGDPDLSIIVFRMEEVSGWRMPPLASEVVDERGVALVREWIAGMAGCP